MSTGAVPKKPDNIIWIEEVILNNTLTSLEGSTPAANAPTTTAAPSKTSFQSKNESSLNEARSHQSISSQEMKIGIAEIELKDESFLGDERIQTLSRIVTGKIKYFIENANEEDEKYQYWIIKMPALLQPQRDLSQTVNAAKREISFYTDILPDMKMWVESRYIDQTIDFRVPVCLFGKFHRPIDESPILDIMTHILDSESLLVLDDLRANGFGKRHFGSGLSMSEAMAAIEEIVKFHAVSWAMQEIEGRKLSWSELYSWQKQGELYYGLLKSNFPTLQRFLLGSNHPKAKIIMAKVTKLQRQLLNRLYSMLVPSEPPLPNTLVHMDFWSENILFRMKEEDRENGVAMEEAELECCVIDWQMVSYGRPTHDLALLIMLSMEPDYRRENTLLLLQYYYELFRKTVGYFDLTVPFDFQMLKREFENSCALATFMAMASIDIVTMEDTTQNRFMEALSDLIEDTLI